MRDAIFGFETLNELPERFHRVGQVDRRAPNRADLIGLILGFSCGC